MAYASRQGSVITNPDAPVAAGQCDRCGFWYSLNDATGGGPLNQQYDWRGPRLANLNLRVCPTCYDLPFEHNRPIITPPDPIPQRNPRPPQTDTGSVGWGMGAWSVGRWSQGQSPTSPATIPPQDLAPPETGGVFEE